ncbi:SDR family NAD(P)-dependent oxidoreductase [Thalassoroseus pseudoceratinae]|uniref:SDR family NAD(P)-dependent oxidoreductase n=1 Tax=Thalassoroseus pseudoceratinae TaxID=2713176 RepID=UPI00141FDDC7|nr:SDR family oxidoreductase [Thalassoroseus pseudoceratinae]
MKTLRGKKALVTGAASGLGRAIALALAHEGVDLFLLDIDEAGLNEVIFEVTALRVCAVGRQCDLTKPEDITAAVEDLKKRWQHVDILVNNAGVAYYGPTHKMTAEQWDWILDINLRAPVRLVQELLPTLLERPESHILNMGSISGLVAGGRFAAYHVSKFGIVGFSEALRAEYGRKGIGVSVLCPGPVRTKLYENAAGGRPEKPVPTPPRWICTTEEKVAKAAVKAIRKNKRMILLTPLAHMLYTTKRIAPWFLDALSQIGRKKKHKATPAKPVESSQQRSRAA